jgi:hypothetical protein
MTQFGQQQSGPSSAEKVIALRAYEASHAAQPSVWSQYQQPSSEPGDAGARVNLAFELGLFYGSAGRLATRVRPFGGVGVWFASQRRPAKPVNDIRVAVGELFAKGDVVSVRRILDALAPEYFDETLRALRGVIAPPTVKQKQQPHGSRSADFQWLKNQSERFTGRWVALHNGELICDGGTLRETLTRAEELQPGVKPLVFRIS